MANAKGKPPGNTEEPEAIESEEETPDGEAEETEDSSEEGSSDEEKGGEEGEEETVEQYLDLTNVPEPLKTVAKKMQATHTRKMQALAMDSRKAAALDDLMNNRDFKLFLADLEAGNPYESRASRSKSVVEESEGEENSSEGKVDMKGIVKAIQPVIQEIVANAIEPLARAHGQTTYEKVRSAHSDFDDYLPEITKIQKEYPGMSLERAYRLAKVESDPDGNERALQKPTKEEIAKGKKLKTLGAGAAKTGTHGVTPSTAKTLRDALKGALAEQGIRVS